MGGPAKKEVAKFRENRTARSVVTGMVTGVIAALAVVGTAAAQTPEEMAKKLSNPVASLISVPFQYNHDSGFGSANGSVSTLNIQPVIPISLNENWNLISRTILPVKSQDNVFGRSGSQTGLGDIVQSFFFSPKEPTAGGLIWGVGPVIYIPTSTDPLLGAGEWGAGVTAVGLKQNGPWTYGALANHIWTIDSNTINATFLQPFMSYTTPEAWSYVLNTESTYDWNAKEWSVPINAMISKLVVVGRQKQMVSLQGGVGYYAASTRNGANGWRARAAVTFLFPK